MQPPSFVALVALVLVVGGANGLLAQEAPQQNVAPVVGYTDTPLLPGGKWHVHDPKRPQPPVVTPSRESTNVLPEAPPVDAEVLFDGSNLTKWQTGEGRVSGWIVGDGAMMVPPRGAAGGGDIVSKEAFGDMQLHIEWRTPATVKGNGQERGNSGVLIMGRYELQVLDSFDNPTYPDGQAGAVYGQTPPLVNASRGPGQWQNYDVFWTAPRFAEGQLQTPAYISVLQNGILVQNHTRLLGATVHRQLASYSAHGAKEALRLQDHGDPVQYRNIWVRPLANAEPDL